MSLRAIITAIRRFVRPQKDVYEHRTYGRTRIWGPDGTELDENDPEYIKIQAEMRAALKASMRSTNDT